MMFLKTLPSSPVNVKYYLWCPILLWMKLHAAFKMYSFLGTDHKRYINYENMNNCLKCKG